ncbi:flap endonuclease GEN homolog 1 isoform X2 [Gouania willdenowi]|uniref:flap endonuclease GEN homolog 1 isoform X2 n=1 Tax=Gouania willdenowi TaxID=441366 RepID=UPI00105690AD|nr:flap endonuclease GEN homolog 1 isoform X2 [Gouania willdenowi]
MGVKDLWSIVEPVCESVPLYSLSGKTLAVDLSLWVCEAQHVQAMMGRVTKPHLRNLFFRVSFLTLMGVKLVFVMEGEAPKLKAETMNKRTEARYGGFKKTATKTTSRGRFNAVLREDPQVDCYQTSRVQSELHLSRENLVGLGILLGCDYIPKGVLGVGREQALKLIRALKGETLLQRFIQWREENTSTSDGVVKKVPHCNLCRHPGSAKAHERSGCLLCDSKHFCEPQDFDYQCPCDWHRHEQTRQDQSFEANIRRKALQSPHFPFTEIITEFLVSKDKSVSHFKRRQPNMLLMQKFAFDKMEWPMHYTSEKVLVLMTYTELMNRKCGRDMLCQIKPLRILKPRVRSGVACFEVIWRTPEHFAYPDDRPADDQHEVRTVEEECLFRVAYPEVVENYMRDKVLAEESKTKKKKARGKKEKPTEGSDALSHLLAEMTLQSSSQTEPPIITSTKKQDAVILNAPVQHKPHGKETDNHTETLSPALPSASAVIESLHLSDIDWDSASFTSSPTPQTVSKHNVEPEQNKNTHRKDEELKHEITEHKTSSHTQQTESRCYTECPLRERLLMRNAVKTVNVKDVYSNITPEFNSNPKSNAHSCDLQVLKEETVNKKIKVPVHQETPDDSRKPPHKYKCVQTAALSSAAAAAPQQLQSDKKAKKTVCASVCSSSEDSDTENQPREPPRRTKTKPKTSSGFISDLTHKPAPLPTARQPQTILARGLKLDAQIIHEEDENIRSVSNGKQSDIVPQAPCSPVTLSESDDSVVCSESPLPLAERLKLRFLE